MKMMMFIKTLLIAVEIIFCLAAEKREVSNSLEFLKARESRFKRQTVIPDRFDAREKWGYCPSIGKVYNQGDCSSSWAISSIATINDRICIGTQGKSKPALSLVDYHECAFEVCNGGTELEVFNYWVKEGIATEGCKPLKQISRSDPKTDCVQKCVDGYSGVWADEKKQHKGIAAYEVSRNDKDEIRREIMTYGPITARIEVESNFYFFRGPGVFYGDIGPTIPGIPKTSPTVKMIGWGSDDGDDYWLCITSFPSIGVNGVIKIRRNTNELKIEEFQKNAGFPGFGSPDEEFLNSCAQPTDIIFVVDSVSANDKTVRTVGHTISFFDIVRRYRVGIILAGDVATTTLELGAESDKEEIEKNIGTYIRQAGTGPVRMDLGISQAINQFETNGRAIAVRAIVLLTKSRISEQGLRTTVRSATLERIHIAVSATDSDQKLLLSRIVSPGMLQLLDSDPRVKVPEDKAYYFLPYLCEDLCKMTDVCLMCSFLNGVYTEGVRGQCDSYNKCRRLGDRNPVQEYCPLGKFWSQNELACVWPSETKCIGDPCSETGRNYWPSPRHCSAYWECKNSRTEQLLCCEKDKRWNPLTETCIDDRTCQDSPYCFQQTGCNHDFIISFKDNVISDSIQGLYIEQYFVMLESDSNAVDNWAAKFNGNGHFSLPYYSNMPLKDSIEIYIRFKLSTTGPHSDIETLVSNGGCIPVDPSLFIGVQRSTSRAFGYLLTENNSEEVDVSIDMTLPYIELWYVYDGEYIKLETKDANNRPSIVKVPSTGFILKSHNALKVGGAGGVELIGHRPFTGYIDEISLARCTSKPN